MDLAELLSKFVAHGCTTVYAKPMAANDNSKNQIYFGPGFDAVNLFPNHGIYADHERGNFKASLQFFWMEADGRLCPAPGAQLILYPQYPEVRFSGFLRGSATTLAHRLNQRMEGRTLFLGVTPDSRTVGYVQLADEMPAESVVGRSLELYGVFHALDALQLTGQLDTRQQLINALRKVHERAWIDSKQLRSDGTISACNAPQCGGFTLEAELGIPKNSKAEPDFLGYEVKQHQVTSFDRPASGSAITLMTPEPKCGYYADQGVVSFIRRFGYPDKAGREDRWNFGGIHKVDRPHATTGLTLRLSGYDPGTHKITDMGGAVALYTKEGEMAAGWSFKEMLHHWTQKHAKAVYVPSMVRTEPSRQYAYGHTVRIADQTDFLKLLAAFQTGAVYYDPGIKLEQASAAKPKEKRRSQFRIHSKDIGALYRTVDQVKLSDG